MGRVAEHALKPYSCNCKSTSHATCPHLPAHQMLTRSRFEEACKAYLDAHPNTRPSGVKTYPAGWSWSEHAVRACVYNTTHSSHRHQYVPNLGYLSRTVQLPRNIAPIDHAEEGELSDPIEDEDDAVCQVLPSDFLTCNQYVVYSVTFGVPTFYFTLHEPSASQ